MQKELSYNLSELHQEHLHLLSKLNEEQMQIYQSIRESLDDNKGQMFFIYGQGGIGKTFLWNTFIAGIRSTGKIVLAIAFSGIALLLLPGKRIAH